MDSQATVNPTFHNANRVVLWYCDGASFSGDAAEPNTKTGTTLYFRGRRVLDAMIDALLANHGLDTAEEVLVSGGSAGGLAAFLHTDYLRSRMPRSVRRFKSSPVSGFFLLHDDDVRALSGLATPQHAESDATARKFRDNRVPISCCQYTFDLLVKYLHHANQMALLAVLNAHISVTIAKGDPAPHTDEAHLSAKQVITGVGPPSKIDKFNAQYDAGRWGVLVDSVEVQALDEFEEEKAREERAKARAAGKPKAPDEAADDVAGLWLLCDKRPPNV